MTRETSGRTASWQWLFCLFGACVAVESSRAAAAESRPNILFLFADDQRADTIAAWGNRHIRTPHLDRLVRRGFSFQGNYCAGSNNGAVCIPSRAMLISGRTWMHVDSAMKQAPILLPEYFRQQGYATFATGKWHNQTNSWLRGFERGKSVFFGGMDDHTKVQVQDLAPNGEFEPVHTASRFSSEEFADAAIDFLQTHDGDRPFFCYVAFTAPHDPRNPPEAFREMYYRRPPPLPVNFQPQHDFDNGMCRPSLRDEALAPWPRPRAMIRDQLCEYYGLITHLDGQIGRILAALERTPKGRNTIIVYAADHGLALGSHGLMGKQSLYEDSMRCPLIVTGPGIPAGKSTRAFSYLLDLFPTLCDVAGLPIPAGLDGRSLRPIWENRVPRVRDTVFLAFTDTMRSVRDERWKLLVYPQINHAQLFDLKRDPYERKNLATDPDHAAVRQRLWDQLQREQALQGDTQPLSVAYPKPKSIDFSKAVQKPDAAQPEWIVKKYFPPGRR